MPEQKWGRRLRGAVVAWSIVSATISPLIGVYKFLSAHGAPVPASAESAGTLAIVVNMCLLTAAVMLFGALTGEFFAAISSRESVRETIGTAIFISLVALLLFSYGGFSPSRQSDYFIGALLLVAVVLSLSPMGPWIAKHFSEAAVVWGMLFILFLLLIPSWMQSIWRTFTKRSDFAIIPLSRMDLWDWVFALIGAGVYVWAYVAFQQWRTEGKWLKEIQDRFRSRS
jgi:hypothetical protein